MYPFKRHLCSKSPAKLPVIQWQSLCEKEVYRTAAARRSLALPRLFCVNRWILIEEVLWTTPAWAIHALSNSPESHLTIGWTKASVGRGSGRAVAVRTTSATQVIPRLTPSATGGVLPKNCFSPAQATSANAIEIKGFSELSELSVVQRFFTVLMIYHRELRGHRERKIVPRNPSTHVFRCSAAKTSGSQMISDGRDSSS